MPLKKFALINFWLLVINLFGFFPMDALAINEPADSPKSVLVKASGNDKIEILHTLTRERWSTDPEEAMKFSQMAYGLALAARDSANIALALKNMGIIYYFTGENQRALSCYSQALKIFTALSDLKGISGCENNMGIIYKDLGDYDKALQYYKSSAAADYRLQDEQGLASTLSNIGEVYHLKGHYDRAVMFYRQSLALEFKYKNPDGVGECLLNIGAAFQENDMYDESMKNYNYALAIFEKTGNKNRIALTLHNLGKLFFSFKDYYKSFIYARKAEKLFYEYGNKQGIAASANLLAIIYDVIGDEEKSDEYFFKAVAMDMELGNKKKIAITLCDKGQDLMAIDEYESATACFLNSMEFARDIGAWPELLDDYKQLSEVYYKLKDISRGLYYDDLYRIFADSLKAASAGLTSKSKQKNEAKIYNSTTQKKATGNVVNESNATYYIIFSLALVVFIIVFIFLLAEKKPNK